MFKDTWINYHFVQEITGYSREYCWKIIKDAKEKHAKGKYSPKGRVLISTLAKHLGMDKQVLYRQYQEWMGEEDQS